MSLIYNENDIVLQNPDRYETIRVSAPKILKSWKKSLFSFEWLLPDGSIRTPEDMQDNVAAQYQSVKDKIDNNNAIKRPVLGVGLIDNVEIGSGKDIFLTLTAHNIETIEVHILRNDKDFFESYKSE